jgi:hypothetical protein
MTNNHPRMTRERRTVEAMLAIYCHGQHGTTSELCEGCVTLRDYARQRLQNCPYQEGKTTCAKCPIHCYRPEMRERIRIAMRYAGPRMLYCHPLMTLQHIVDGFRKEPIRVREADTSRAKKART